MYRLFDDCHELRFLDVSNWDTSSVTDMFCMFGGCSELRFLDLTSFDTSKVTDMQEMFVCPALRTIALGSKFAFEGALTERQCSLPDPSDLLTTRHWVSSSDGVAYGPDEIPSGVAANYVAQAEGESPKTVIDKSMFSVDAESREYTGSSIEPVVSAETLREGVDYAISYRDNMDVGTGIVCIVGIGSYAGELRYAFRIDPKRLPVPAPTARLVYSGGEQVGVAPSDDYAVTGGSATNARDYTAAASLRDKKNCVWAGTGNSDDVRVPWSIAKAEIGKASIAAIGAQAWTGSQIEPEPAVTFNGKALEKDTDYTVSYGENKDSGKNSGSVTVTAVEGGNFTGSATVYFDIEKKAEPVNPDPGIGGGADPTPTPDPGTGGGSGGSEDAPAPAPQQFAVAYHLDGGVNAASNPATYTAGTAVALADPTREGFEFQGWYADPKFKKQVTEIAADSTGDVELWAKWKEREQKPAPVFPDVDYSSWYGKAVTYVAEKGLITGYAAGDKAGMFGVGDTLTRAQLATILWRNACPDEAVSYDPASAKDTTGIAGSADGQYYTAAANWAVRNGVITGFVRDDGTQDFAAGDPVTFEQLITILTRLCATPEELASEGSDLSGFADGDEASS